MQAQEKFLVIGRAIYPTAKDKQVIRRIIRADNLGKAVQTVQNTMDMSYVWNVWDVVKGDKQ